MEFDFDNLTDEQITEIVADAKEEFEYARSVKDDIVYKCTEEHDKRWMVWYNLQLQETKDQWKRESDERKARFESGKMNFGELEDYCILYGDG